MFPFFLILPIFPEILVMKARLIEADDTTWDASTYSRKDALAAGLQNPFNIATFDGDISAFKNAGGKIRIFPFLNLTSIFRFPPNISFYLIRN